MEKMIWIKEMTNMARMIGARKEETMTALLGEMENSETSSMENSVKKDSTTGVGAVTSGVKVDSTTGMEAETSGVGVKVATSEVTTEVTSEMEVVTSEATSGMGMEVEVNFMMTSQVTTRTNLTQTMTLAKNCLPHPDL